MKLSAVWTRNLIQLANNILKYSELTNEEKHDLILEADDPSNAYEIPNFIESKL
jgi:hypothetical protein